MINSLYIKAARPPQTLPVMTGPMEYGYVGPRATHAASWINTRCTTLCGAPPQFDTNHDSILSGQRSMRAYHRGAHLHESLVCNTGKRLRVMREIFVEKSRWAKVVKGCTGLHFCGLTCR